MPADALSPATNQSESTPLPWALADYHPGFILTLLLSTDCPPPSRLGVPLALAPMQAAAMML